MKTITLKPRKATKTATKKKAVTKVTGPKVVAVTPKTIGKTKALELMQNNKGHFFTATFVKKEGEIRTMNCQYLKDQTHSQLGYVRVREAIKAKAAKTAKKRKKKAETDIRNINLQTLLELKIAGSSYKVR